MKPIRIDINKNKISLPLRIGWLDLICFQRCVKRKNKIEYLKQCKEVIKSKISIEHIIEKFCELDKLKKILSNPEQLELLRRLPKLTLEQHIKSIQEANNWKIHSILSPKKGTSSPKDISVNNLRKKFKLEDCGPKH